MLSDIAVLEKCIFPLKFGFMEIKRSLSQGDLDGYSMVWLVYTLYYQYRYNDKQVCYN